MKAVQLRKRKMVEDLIKVHLDRYEASGAELIMGEARFTSPKTVAVSLNNGGTRADCRRARFSERGNARDYTQYSRIG